jgi:hypothetical protein
MTTIIKTISVSSKENELIQRFNLSPTQIIKQGLAQYRDLAEGNSLQIAELERRIKALQEVINKQRDFMEKHNLMDEFLGLNQDVQSIQEK